MEVDIIGTGLTCINYDWNRNVEKWSIGSAFGSFGDRIDTYFCMHQGQYIDTDVNQINLLNYPIEEIEAKYKSSYFNNSISYMIAYALYNGYKKIKMWGVDIEKRSEYAFERPCVLYWMGLARGMGMEIETSSNLGEIPFKYGYDAENMSAFLSMLELKEQAYRRNAEIKEGDEKHQWIGAMYATQKIIDYVRG